MKLDPKQVSENFNVIEERVNKVFNEWNDLDKIIHSIDREQVLENISKFIDDLQYIINALEKILQNTELPKEEKEELKSILEDAKKYRLDLLDIFHGVMELIKKNEY
ncbi:MAG: hypothetical protein ABIF17_04305 [Patescibacteria group bacterium]